jgi:hypothetical protein
MQRNGKSFNKRMPKVHLGVPATRSQPSTAPRATTALSCFIKYFCKPTPSKLTTCTAASGARALPSSGAESVTVIVDRLNNADSRLLQSQPRARRRTDLSSSAFVLIWSSSAQIVIHTPQLSEHARRRNPLLRGKNGSSPVGLSLMIATAIGLRNLSQGLTIGHSCAQGLHGLTTTRNMDLHNATEGTGIVGPVQRGKFRAASCHWPPLARAPPSSPPLPRNEGAPRIMREAASHLVMSL